MAMTFSSKGCRDAANDLTKSANNLSSLLESLKDSLNKVKAVYQSESADEIYAAFEKMNNKFPDFIQSVKNCSDYLENTVAPAYEKLETAAASKIQ